MGLNSPAADPAVALLNQSHTAFIIFPQAEGDRGQPRTPQRQLPPLWKGAGWQGESAGGRAVGTGRQARFQTPSPKLSF